MLGASPRRCDGRNDAPVTRRHWTPRLPAPFAAACCRPLWPRTELRVLLSLQGSVLLSPSTPGSNGCHLLPAAARAGVHPPRRSFLLANSRLFSGWRESSWKSLPGQGNRKPWKESEEPGGVGRVPRAVPRAGAMPAEGRERESHVSLRQPCCAAVDPYVPTPVSVSINRPRGRAGQCAAPVGGEEGD